MAIRLEHIPLLDRLSMVQFTNLQNWVRTWTTLRFRFRCGKMAILAEPAPEPEVWKLWWENFLAYLAQIRSWTSGAPGSHLNWTWTSGFRFRHKVPEPEPWGLAKVQVPTWCRFRTWFGLNMAKEAKKISLPSLWTSGSGSHHRQSSSKSSSCWPYWE